MYRVNHVTLFYPIPAPEGLAEVEEAVGGGYERRTTCCVATAQVTCHGVWLMGVLEYHSCEVAAKG